MKILIACSKYFYSKIPEIKTKLENLGHEIFLPNSYDDPLAEEEIKKTNPEEHIKWKSEILKKHEKNIESKDAILVLNFEKNNQQNYMGGATFMEIIKAWELNKKIFLYNPIPNCSFTDEIVAMKPKILNRDLSKISPKKIEVEIQNFITEEKYKELLEFFRQNAEFVKADFQETFYFDENSNLRIQRNNKEAKLWHKSGNVHDEFMEEIEIHANRDEFEKMEKFLNKLGHSAKIKWLRLRNQFNWNGIKVCLDHTKGYGYIIELEKMSSDEDKEKILAELKQKLSELGVEQTPKEVFTEKYNYYKENWRSLI